MGIEHDMPIRVILCSPVRLCSERNGVTCQEMQIDMSTICLRFGSEAPPTSVLYAREVTWYYLVLNSKVRKLSNKKNSPSSQDTEIILAPSVLYIDA